MIKECLNWPKIDSFEGSKNEKYMTYHSKGLVSLIMFANHPKKAVLYVIYNNSASKTNSGTCMNWFS